MIRNLACKYLNYYSQKYSLFEMIATALYDRDTVLELVNSFKDSSVGAVSALYRVPNSEDSHVSASEHKFWLHKDEVRILESSIHSTSWLSGEACAFRNKIIM